MKRLSWFVFFSITAISCLDQPDCFQLNNNVAVVGFKIIGGGTDVVSLTQVTSPGASDVIAKKGDVSSVNLSLNPYANEISYAFEGTFKPNGEHVVNQLNFSYLALVQFVSEDCGERHVFNDMKVISSNFDSVRILNTVPTNPPTSNFDIYRCPVTNIIKLDFVNAVPLQNITILSEPSAPPMDGTVFTVNGTLSSALLPLALDTVKARTTYVFTYDSGETDTLTVTYKTTHRIISPRCGRQIFIDSIRYVSPPTGFKTVTVKEDSIHDLATLANLELTR
jgi:hypothetical protein